MGLFDALRAGVIELLAHKMRSFLTMLGIIFGVAAVIDIGRELCAPQMDAQNIDASFLVRAIDENLAIKTAGTQQRAIENIWSALISMSRTKHCRLSR